MASSTILSGSIFPCYPLAMLLLSGMTVQLLSPLGQHLCIKQAPLQAKLELFLLHQLALRHPPYNFMCELKEMHRHINE